MTKKFTNGFDDAISPVKEMAAYEALWLRKKASFKVLADLFKQHPDNLPSEMIDNDQLINDTYKEIKHFLNLNSLTMPGIKVNGSMDYPERLRDAKNPVEVLYYQGDWDLAYTDSIAIVGARKASKDGLNRAYRLARLLIEDGFTVVSGLAQGIDRVAHETAIKFGGKTIAVIGTPLTEFYPKENAPLQKQIAKEHLLISQVPFLYHSQIKDYRVKSRFFPERNVTMSALSKATVIVEASDTSGTLYQARAALAQGRKLFIMDSCFERKDLAWPKAFLAKGAIRVTDYSDIKKHI